MNIDEARIKLAVESSLEEAADNLLAELKRKMPNMLIEERRVQAEFEGRLYKRWQKGLDLFETILKISVEVGDTFNQKHRPQAAKENDLVFEVVARLHARACLTASEVKVLLKSGHASGALARQRTLHELAVVTYFIHEHGNELAERYLLHEVVESKKVAEQYEKYCIRLGYRPLDPNTIADLRNKYDALCIRFGETFKTTYGWAAQALNKTQPTIEDIERAVQLDHMRPNYRMASHGIHPNPKGIAFNLGNIGPQKVMLAGPSNAGLADPGHAALISLLQCTAVLLGTRSDIETSMVLQVLNRLVDEAGQAFLEAHNLLISEELALAKLEEK